VTATIDLNLMSPTKTFIFDIPSTTIVNPPKNETDKKDKISNNSAIPYLVVATISYRLSEIYIRCFLIFPGHMRFMKRIIIL